MKIVHLSSVDPHPNSGMGRVSYFWQQAILAAHHQFQHIGLNTVAPHRKIHPLLQGWYFRKYLKKNNVQADIILAHEPLCGWLPVQNIPLISFSHGVEQRAWEQQLQYGILRTNWYTRLLPASLRFYANMRGFKRAHQIWVLNNADKNYLVTQKKLPAAKIKLIQNGYLQYAHQQQEPPINHEKLVFLFNGSWIIRKGIDVLVQVFNTILQQQAQVQLRIAGTGWQKEKILSCFHPAVQSQIELIPSFDSNGEAAIYNGALFFVLPSYLEGQSLALNQAMAMGICPIVSDNSGQIDLVHHMQEGLICRTGDVNDWIEKINWCIQHVPECVKMGAKAKALMQPFTWAAVGHNMVQYCETLVQEGCAHNAGS